MTVLTAERLRELLRYDPETGAFYWLVGFGRARLGEIAGCFNSHGYWTVGVDGHRYLAHRLAWLYVTGEWPNGHIDHIDLDGTNNRWVNLRQATQSQNMCNTHAQINNRLGVKGVIRLPYGKYRATVRTSRVTHFDHVFDTLDEARSAWKVAAEAAYGEFARWE